MNENNNNNNNQYPNGQNQGQYQYQNQGQYQNQYQPPQDAKSIGFGILGFFFPLVGLILFLVWRTEKPLKAKSAGIGAIVGVVLQIIGYIIFIVAFGALAIMSDPSYL